MEVWNIQMAIKLKKLTKAGVVLARSIYQYDVLVPPTCA